MTLGGRGQLVVRTGGDVCDARVETTGETVINGPLHTVRGEGAITCPFTNQGRISADLSGRRLLLTGPGMSNEGLVEARNTDVLELSTRLTQGQSGTVLADGGIGRLSNGSVVYGTIDSANDGVVESVPGTNRLSGLTNNGTITLNQLHEPGGAVLNGCGYCSVTLGGTGELVMCTAGGSTTPE